MQCTPEPAPRMELTPIQHVEGVEIARLFDWYGPRVLCFPGFTFSTPTCTGLATKFRYGALERVASRGVLMTVPNHVVRVDEQSVRRGWSAQEMAFGIAVPATTLTGEEQRRLTASTLNPLLEAPVWEQWLLCLGRSLVDPDLLACEKETYVRAFLERALAETDVVRKEATGGCDRAVKRARDYVEANVARVFSLEEVARETGLTKWHLARIFRKTMGVPVGEYARHLRAHHALRMLRGGTKASVVAAELGYCDQPHLTREMRSLFGFTPRHYAKNSVKSQAATRTEPPAA